LFEINVYDKHSHKEEEYFKQRKIDWSYIKLTKGDKASMIEYLGEMISVKEKLFNNTTLHIIVSSESLSDTVIKEL
jgi:hypothetical protein